mmetsp:Transcript_52978/g.140858  ORF Transcript_52978/g.140858 Transcript_52978/m.140858 type:complete len:238 (-) Transcript_52978:533-1246(-)
MHLVGCAILAGRFQPDPRRRAGAFVAREGDARQLWIAAPCSSWCDSAPGVDDTQDRGSSCPGACQLVRCIDGFLYLVGGCRVGFDCSCLSAPETNFLCTLFSGGRHVCCSAPPWPRIGIPAPVVACGGPLQLPCRHACFGARCWRVVLSGCDAADRWVRQAGDSMPRCSLSAAHGARRHMLPTHPRAGPTLDQRVRAPLAGDLEGGPRRALHPPGPGDPRGRSGPSERSREAIEAGG